MLKKILLDEFLYEADNTRKILTAIPDSALDFKPTDFNWITAQLASHIAEVYNWYKPTFNLTEMDMGLYKYDKGDISKAANIVAKFEANFNDAKQVLENITEETLFENWSMVMGGNVLMPPMPKIQVARGFLMNHLYHHRGELVVYLRASGNKVPALYGRTYEDNLKQ